MLGLICPKWRKVQNRHQLASDFALSFQSGKDATRWPHFFSKCKNATSWPQIWSVRFVYSDALLAALRSPPEAPTQAFASRLEALGLGVTFEALGLGFWACGSGFWGLGS